MRLVRTIGGVNESKRDSPLRYGMTTLRLGMTAGCEVGMTALGAENNGSE
jgi:hypothetical protein